MKKPCSEVERQDAILLQFQLIKKRYRMGWNGIGCGYWCRHRDEIYLIRIFQAGVFCWSDWEKQKVNPKDRNEDKNNLCRLHHHVDVRVVPIEVVLKVQFCPRVASINNSGQNDKT